MGLKVDLNRVTKESLIGLRQQLDEAIQSGSSDTYASLFKSLTRVLKEFQSQYPADQDRCGGTKQILSIINSVWANGSTPPDQLPGDEDTSAGLTRLISGISDVQKFALSLGKGDLSQSLKAKGLMAGSLKSLQANLRHLSWQTRMIASGDLSQKVDFMGEFSDSFNSMVESLADARNQLEQREIELSEANARLADEIEEVRRGDAKLKEVNRELEAFSYSVSHDLRAPLRHMSGFVELLQKRLKGNPDDQILHYASAIAGASRKMGRLIDDLLAFSRMGRAALKKSRLNFRALVSEAIKGLQHEMEGRNISWKIDRLPDIYGDKAMLDLAIANLISNAVKYTGTRSPAEIEIGFNEEASEFIFFVRDNGVGFDMKYAHKLFGVFQRLHTDAEFEGTGIGLANVQRIVSRHGGRVWAEGMAGKGATFYFTLPK